MNPLRVAFVYDMDACRGPTGVTRHALAQLENLAQRGDSIALQAITGRITEPDGRDHWRSLGGLPRRELPLRTRTMLRLWRTLGGPSLEWWTGPLDWSYSPAEYFITTRRARRAVTSHDVLQDITYGGPRRRALLGRIFGGADLILSVSRFNTERLLEAFPVGEDRVALVPNAPEDLYHEPATESQRAAAWNDLGLPPGTPFLLSVANVQPRKNLVRLVRAASRLKEVAEGAMALALVGTGDVESPELSAAIDGVGERVRIVTPGYRQGEALRAIYSVATALVFPSLCESFGIPAVEAMAQGCPVALADSTALPEIAGEAGWYFDPTDEEAITAGVRALLDDDAERARRVALGREIAAGYRWSTAADRLVEALQARS